MGTHSLLSPSTAPRWMLCPASVNRCKDLPETTSSYADEGTAAHEMAANIIKGSGTIPEKDNEMYDFVRVYVDTVKEMTKGSIFTWVEESLDLSGVVGVSGERGTADFIALLPSGELQVHDLKYGKGVKVDAQGNYQLIIYALGALEIASLIEDNITQVRLVIHQPRLSHVSEVLYTIDELLAYQNKLREVAKLAVDPTCEIYNPGEKQCRFCGVKGNCLALSSFALKSIADDFEVIPDTPEILKSKIDQSIKRIPELRPDEISKIVANLDLITKWVSAVEEYAMSEMLKGEKFPGLKLVAGRTGNRQWSDEKEAEKILKSMRLKQEEMYSFKLITPTVAEKLLKDTPRRWNRLTEVITRKDGSPTIVPETDKRPALVLTAAIDDFADETMTVQ